MYSIKLEQFEGPLDLLLQLIESEELDITKLSLSKVADQYLEYLNETKDLSLEELADFLVVAAKLLLIKSKVLLPSLYLGEGDEAGDLEKQLKIYREYLEASRKLHKLELLKRFSFSREKLPLDFAQAFHPPKGLTGDILAETFRQVLADLEPLVAPPQKTLKKVISLREKIRQIQDLVYGQDKVSFANLIRQSKSKVEIIVNFLALLELVKERKVAVFQDELFQDIDIKKAEEGGAVQPIVAGDASEEGGEASDDTNGESAE